MQTTIIKEIEKDYLKDKDILLFIEFLFDKFNINKELEFNILFGNDEKISALNKQFRDKDEPTDILSFYGYSDDVFGDIIISIETMEEEARQKDEPLFDYVLFLIAHGFLHIAGYTHETTEKYERMIGLQNRLIKEWKNGKTD